MVSASPQQKASTLHGKLKFMRLSQDNCSVTLCACTSTLHTPTSTPLYEASCFANLTANVMPNFNCRSFALTLSTISPALTSESGESWHRTENKRRRGRGTRSSWHFICNLIRFTNDAQTKGIQKLAWETAKYNHELKTLTQEAL